MRSPIAALLAGLALGVAVMVPAGPPAMAEARTLERIVAVVNDRVILASDLEDEMALVRQRLQQEGESVPPDHVLRERMLDELITEDLQIQRAHRFGITVDDDAVNRALRQLAEDNDTDLAGLRDMFAAQGIEFASVREDLRNHLTIQQLRQRAVASRVSISEQDVEDFLARIERLEDREAEYRLQHILIAAPGDANGDVIEEARAQAETVYDDLDDGADFERLAAEVSDGPRALSGGDLGWRTPDRLPALFVEAIEDLQPGEIAAPVRSANGFHILRLADRRGGDGDRSITETRARHILIRGGEGPETDDSEAHDRIVELRGRLQAGASFDSIARGHSEDPGSAAEGGDLGWFGPGDMSPAFQQVVDELAVGELSEPFRTEFGWHIVEVQDRRQREDAERYRRARARQLLYEERVQEETQRWLGELRDEAFVEIRLDGRQSGG